ncbi:pectinesterase family protein [Pedobacter aquatilis]|uniref:pectinesterase family protein n=1 Tax=Pedobacter aquatilis TaxID=351343 RepID=UPI0025B39479|nr:pectinesterase family protein [Pedobacter aquatilis]MDN3587763.1 pectinesterase family protein [Pedobacter aquatilis]
MKLALLIFLSIFCLNVKAVEIKADFIVAQDGSGNFKTVQEAINAVPDFRNKTTTIFIKKGIYKEKLILAGSKKNVKFIGEDLHKTILTYDDFAQKKNAFGEDKGTSGSSSFYIYAEGFSAENLTFENSSGPVGQAVAVWVGGDKSTFLNCRFLGFQDTLYTYGANNRQYYKNCYIEGTVDYIFGAATAWFENCTLFCKKSGYISAASTADTTKFGYVFNNCKVDGDAPNNSFYLGRPWRPYAKVAFLNCELSAIIKPEGWNNWGKESNEQTAYYAEYNNKGTGAKATSRVNWAHQLTRQEFEQYTLENVFRGWLPMLK